MLGETHTSEDEAAVLKLLEEALGMVLFGISLRVWKSISRAARRTKAASAVFQDARRMVDTHFST